MNDDLPSSGLILVVHRPEHRERIVPGLELAEMEFVVRTITGLEDELESIVGQELAEVDVLLIGEGVPSAIKVAQRLRESAPFSEMIFLVPEDRLTHFRSMLPFIPQLGAARADSSGASQDHLLHLLRDCVQAARQRRSARDIHARINEILEGHTPLGPSERARRATDAYLSSVLSQAGDPIFVVAGDGTLLAWNEAAATFFGRSIEAAEPFSLFDFALTEDHQQLRQVLQRAAEGDAVGRYVAPLRNAAGETRDLEMNLTRLIDPGDEQASLSCVCRDLTEHLRTESQLRAALEEREVLIREVHHRVRNNLQLIVSMLQLQARSLSESGRAPLLDMSSRVSAMAKVHERLSSADRLAAVDVQSFLEDLCTDLVRTFNVEDCITIRPDLKSVSLDLGQATPVALILAELITNALKHAFPTGRKGTIRISGKETAGFGEIIVSDDGIGTSSGAMPRRGALGRKIVDVLTQQIRGEIDIRSDRGTTVALRFPKS